MVKADFLHDMILDKFIEDKPNSIELLFCKAQLNLELRNNKCLCLNVITHVELLRQNLSLLE